MKTLQLLRTAHAVGRARFLQKKAPLVVGWAITDRCNRQCAYCDIPGRPRPEMSTGQIFALIDELARLGTLRISFTGGEPLLRQDMGQIVDHAHNRGLNVKLNSNGTLVPARIDELGRLETIHLSLEGPEKIHDAIRGPGSFQEVMKAAEAARSHGIQVNFATVLTRSNLDAVDYLLDQAAQVHGRVILQPATPNRLGGSAINDLAPDKEAYRQSMAHLLEKKRRGHPAIGNSLAGLQHLSRWPEPTAISCASGWISCRLEPDGQVRYCGREPFSFAAQNCLAVPLAQAFSHLVPISCEDCWCAGRVDLNLAFSLRRGALVDQIKTQIWR
ncbi:MAG: radical SAM protein [Desulfosudaceae bacterium]